MPQLGQAGEGSRGHLVSSLVAQPKIMWYTHTQAEDRNGATYGT